MVAPMVNVEHVAEVTVITIRLDLQPNDMNCVLTPNLHQ
jgi:hypothetical protein